MQPQQALIIGLDGATWDVLDPWIKDGTLPNLARLRRNGCWGVLQSSIPPITAAAWSTFMTGKRPARHGVFHFIKLFNENDTTAGEPELVSAQSIKSPMLWDILGHHGRQVGLVNIPLTYPPRPVNGFMVTGLLTPKNAAVFTYPPELSETITDYMFDLDRFVDKKPFMDAIDGEIAAPTLALVQEFRDMLEKRIRVTRELMETRPWDLFMIVFIGTDRMGHYLWPYHHAARLNGAAGPETLALCQAVREYYVRLDEIVGELVERAGPEAAVIVMSDHGMGPKYTRRVHVNNWMRQRGWLAAKGGGKKAVNPDGWLKRLGLSRDRIGRLILRLPGLANSRLVKRAASASGPTVDVERSRAYAVPIFNHIFGIRVNAAGAEREALIAEIERALPEVADPTTGLRLVQSVCRGAEYYDGPYAEHVPDLIVMMDPDYGGSFRLGSYSSLITELQSHTRRGQHRMEGIFMASGPGIVAADAPLPGLRIEDVTPTVLYLMDLPVPDDMDGRVLAEIVTPARLAEQPIEHCEPAGFWPSGGAAEFQEEEMSAEDEAAIRERLHALGYID